MIENDSVAVIAMCYAVSLLALLEESFDQSSTFQCLVLPLWLFPLKLNIIHQQELLHASANKTMNSSCRDVWTEYDEMNRESFRKIEENKVYTSKTILDLLRFVAPKTMQRAETHFSHGIADNLDDPTYDHYKYWSNPLETK